MSAGEQDESRSFRYALLLAATVAVSLAGYAGYELYPRFGLPPAEGATLIALAVGAGIASFFSPCAFPLLATLLARQGAVGEERGGGRPRPWRFAVALSLGAAVFLTLAGVAIGLGAGSVFAGVTFTSVAGRTLRAVVAVLLVVLGLGQLGVFPDFFRPVEHWVKPMLAAQAEERRRRPFVGFTFVGFGYLLAGFG